MRSIIVLILIFTFGSIRGNPNFSIALSCKFRGKTSYSCNVIGLENCEENSYFSSVIGKHEKGKSNDDVQGFIVKSQNISVIPKNIEKLFPNLINIEVKSSHLLEVTKKTFTGLHQLEKVSLANNFISSLPQDALSELKNLKSLELSNNKLKQLHYKTFFHNQQIEVLRLEGNQLASIHEQLFINQLNLKEIHLENNLIEELREKTFANNQMLEIIDISKNRLKEIGPLVLENLSHLKHFNFSNNKCIVDHTSNVKELTELLRSFCLPPNFERFEKEIEYLKSSEKNKSEALDSCTKAFDEQNVTVRDLQSKIDYCDEIKKKIGE